MRAWLSLIALVFYLPSSARGDVASEVRRFTGRPTRLVWAQASDASDLTAQRSGFRLYGLDTEDGKGIRLLQGEPGCYSKPLLTPDGRYVVYSDRTRNAIFLVDFGGGGRRQLAQGFATHAWSQEGDRLILRLRTPQTGENGVSPELELCRLSAGKPQHVAVTYAPGRLVCYLEGRAVLATDKIKGDFSNWSAQHLLFGNEWDGARDWAGTIEAVAVYSRVLSAAEVSKSYQLHHDRLTARKAPERVVVDARLLAVSPVPDPRVISPYLRALVVNEYLIEKAVEGQCGSPKILVAEWGVMDRKTLPNDRAVGKTYRLAIEKFDQHQELQPEKLVMGVDEIELPLYYAVRQ